MINDVPIVKNNGFEKVKNFLARLVFSDTLYRKLRFFYKNKRILNLQNPLMFSEKLNWLMIHTDYSQYCSYVDKFEIRKFVREKVGDQYLNKLYGVFTHEDQIDFDTLPNQFALKATHGSGMNYLCKDKTKINQADIRSLCHKWLSYNYFERAREKNYIDIQPRIICKKYRTDKFGVIPVDLKFYCFHGKVRYISVDFDRFTNHTRNVYALDWELLPYSLEYPRYDKIYPKPNRLSEMINLAETLSEGMPFVRVDLYLIQGEIIFGEMTFSPSAGFFEIDYPLDKEMGTWLQI